MAHPEDIAENARMERDARDDDEIPCPECDGQGFTVEDDAIEGPTTVECDECDGSGTLPA